MTRIITAVLAVGALVASLPASAEAAPRKGTFGKHASYSGLKIGMGIAKANRTGKIKRARYEGACAHTTFKKIKASVGIFISRKVGVAIIGAPVSARTPRGIGTGSTVKQLRKAYPKLHYYVDAAVVTVPGYRHVEYGFQLYKGKVDVMWIQHDRQDCAN